ncbi:MAG: alternative ribosome rescue aminoacyl-tRNA hydrolase ArfB [Bdellovibrionia bacterium]
MAVRSRGPGGQNVNKVSSAALLFWKFETSPSISAEQKHLIRAKLPNWVNKEGEIFVRSDEYRDLERNKARCLEKLEELLTRAFHRPKPRRATKPTRASKQRRLDTKKRRGDTKKQRGSKDW